MKTRIDPDWYHYLISTIEDLQEEGDVWTARLCRRLNDYEETVADIQHCGRCTDYANQRKRKRAQHWSEHPQQAFPDFDRPYQLHEPCTRMRLKRLQHMVRLLEQRQVVYRCPRSRIPDPCQPRGWDFGTIIHFP